MKRIFIAMAICIASISGQAAEAERYVGKRPQQLLKLPEFAKAYRAATRNVELPAWTKRLGTGQSAEIIAIGGNKWILASACSKNGCQDERIYILFDPENKSANGFFFLPPDADDPGDSRTAFSQWFGNPAKEASDFLLERAVSDAQSLKKPNH